MTILYIQTNKTKGNVMDLNKLRKRIAEEEARLKRFEEQKKFSQINSEADFKRALKEWALKQNERKS